MGISHAYGGVLSALSIYYTLTPIEKWLVLCGDPGSRGTRNRRQSPSLNITFVRAWRMELLYRRVKYLVVTKDHTFRQEISKFCFAMGDVQSSPPWEPGRRALRQGTGELG